MDMPRQTRIGFWSLLVVGWAVMVGFMWDALTMVPSAERLEESRMAVIPTPRTFFTAVIFSALELAVVLAALWPWRPGFYATRLGVTALALTTWFVITIPMGLSRMDWVHRRWLVVMVIAVSAALVITLGYRLLRRVRILRRPGTDSNGEGSQ
jgi:hypothetical protein